MCDAAKEDSLCHFDNSNRDLAVDNNNLCTVSDVNNSVGCTHSTQSIASLYSNLDIARRQDSTWTPVILMPIPTPSAVKNLLDNPAASSVQTDIVKHMSKPTIQLSLIYENECKYPKGCSFLFGGYNGTEDAKRLTSDIIKNASVYGTSLTILTNDLCKNKNK